MEKERQDGYAMQRSRHSPVPHARPKFVEYMGSAQLLGVPAKDAVQPAAGLFPARSTQTVPAGCGPLQPAI